MAVLGVSAHGRLSGFTLGDVCMDLSLVFAAPIL